MLINMMDYTNRMPGAVRRMQPKPPADKAPVGRDSMLSKLLNAPDLEQLPRGAAGDRPEFDAKRAKHLQWASAAAMLMSGLSMVADAPVGAGLMGGLSQGYAQAGMNQRSTYNDQLNAWYDRALDVDKANVGISNQNAKMRYDAGSDAAKMLDSWRKEDADRADDKSEREEDARHNRRLAEIRENENATRHERDEAEARERERHNKELEKVASRNADANMIRAEKSGSSSTSKKTDEAKLQEWRDKISKVDIEISGLQQQIRDTYRPSEKVALETKLMAAQNQRQSLINNRPERIVAQTKGTGSEGEPEEEDTTGYQSRFDLSDVL